MLGIAYDWSPISVSEAASRRHGQLQKPVFGVDITPPPVVGGEPVAPGGLVAAQHSWITERIQQRMTETPSPQKFVQRGSMDPRCWPFVSRNPLGPVVRDHRRGWTPCRPRSTSLSDFSTLAAKGVRIPHAADGGVRQIGGGKASQSDRPGAETGAVAHGA